MYWGDFRKQLPSELFVVDLGQCHSPASRGDLTQVVTRFERRWRRIELAWVQPKGRLNS